MFASLPSDDSVAKSTPSTTDGPDAGQHGVEAGLAVAHHHRIAIARVRGAGRGQGRLALGRIGLVPARDVVLDNGFDVGHGNSPSDVTLEGERESAGLAISSKVMSEPPHATLCPGAAALAAIGARRRRLGGRLR